MSPERRDRPSTNRSIDDRAGLRQYHSTLIEKGICQADAGELVDHGEVEEMAAKLGRAKKIFR